MTKEMYVIHSTLTKHVSMHPLIYHCPVNAIQINLWYVKICLQDMFSSQKSGSQLGSVLLSAVCLDHQQQSMTMVGSESYRRGRDTHHFALLALRLLYSTYKNTSFANPI